MEALLNKRLLFTSAKLKLKSTLMIQRKPSLSLVTQLYSNLKYLCESTHHNVRWSSSGIPRHRNRWSCCRCRHQHSPCCHCSRWVRNTPHPLPSLQQSMHYGHFPHTVRRTDYSISALTALRKRNGERKQLVSYPPLFGMISIAPDEQLHCFCGTFGVALEM